MVHIVDNFLPPSLHQRFQNMMLGAEFPWYFVKGVTDHTDNNYYFIHNVYGCIDKGNGFRDVESPYFKDIEVLLFFIEEKLKFQIHDLHRIKCNMYTNQNINLAHGKHTDHQEPHYTAIYYLNDNNGPTTVGDQDVNSVANRLVFFDGLTLHNSNLQTDVAERVNININMTGEFLSA